MPLQFYNYIMSDCEMDSAEQQQQTTVSNNEEAGVSVEAKKLEPVDSTTETTQLITTVANGGALNTLQNEEKMELSSVKNEQQQLDKNYEEMDAYKMFLSKNLSKPVANTLIRMFDALQLTTDEFDDRAVEMLATFPLEQANYIIKELRDSNLYGVQNKPQYLMSVMRNFRDRLRSMGVQQAMDLPLIPGPEPDKIKAIIDRTGYQLEVTVGQRKYHSPPNYDGPDPNQAGDGGCIYIGQLPRDIYEDALIPLFEECGTIYDLRIMMDPLMGKSRGYGFLIYCDKSCASEAAKKYDGHEILPGKPLKVNVSVANTRLFLGNIPKSKSKDEILDELRKHAENITDVIIYSNPDAHDGRKNRGFCFVDFTDHKAASDAKRRISMGKIRPWNTDLVVDWAEQQDEPDDDVMSTVKVLYVRNLKEAVTEQRLKEIFEQHGEVEKVKRIKDYAFIHFKDRPAAIQAMEALNNTAVDGVEIEISLAKPQGDQNQKKKLAMKRFGNESGGGGMKSTPGMSGGGSRGGRGGGNYGQQATRSGRGGAGPSQRGGYPAYPGYHPPPYGHPAYDPYYASYAGAYAPGYEMYGAYAQADPYYAPPVPPPYGSAPPMRGGPSGYGYGTIPRGRGGKATGGGGGRGGGKRGGSGRGSSKRAGGDFGGPASKRGGRSEDFSTDISMNMF